MTWIALITGASGKIGRHAASAFERAGWQVRRYQRGTDMAEAARGASVIVNGMNPPNYHAWARIIPEITAQHIDAARDSGATVILPGNVYNFGIEPGPWGPETPQRPVSRKGRIRVEMEHAYRAAGVPTIVLRAGNFIDPAGTDDVMSIIHLRGLSRGRLGHAGRSDARQAWCYVPDWADAAVALAEQRDKLATFEDVPFPGYSFTVEELKVRLERLTGRSLKLSPFPWWLLRLASPVWELGRELTEMRYLSDLDHSLSGDRLATLVPDFRVTPLDDVLRRKLPESQPRAVPTPA